MPNQFDFGIIGAGPAGAFLSLKLAKQGYNVVLIDRLPSPKRKICGEYLCPRGVELLARHNLYEDFAKKFLPITGMNLYSSQGTSVSTSFPKEGIEYDGLAVNRQEFDGLLIEFAREAGVHCLFGQVVEGVQAQDSIWKVITRSQYINCNYIVGADGRLSKTATLLGVSRRSSKKRLALHCYLKSKTVNSRKGEMHLFADGSYIGIDPINDREINFSLVCNANLVKNYTDLQSLINNYILQSNNLHLRFDLLDKKTKVFTISPINNRTSKISGENWALVGDASGFIDPLTGEGIYNALLTGEILAEEVSLAKTTDLSIAFKKYAARRKKQFLQKSMLNLFFQWFIAKPRLVEWFAKYLLRDKRRGDIFIGIIGNIYSPLKGLYKLLPIR